MPDWNCILLLRAVRINQLFFVKTGKHSRKQFGKSACFCAAVDFWLASAKRSRQSTVA